MLTRHVRRLWALPGTALGVVRLPATPSTRLFGRWDYWWQAHLLDALVDAQLRAPSERRRRQVAAVVRGLNAHARVSAAAHHELGSRSREQARGARGLPHHAAGGSNIAPVGWNNRGA